MQAMLCIDFGNSYTKVALRKHTHPDAFALFDESQTTPVTDRSLRWDFGLYVCVPSTVVRTEEGSQHRYFYGSEVEQVALNRRDHPGTMVYRNWKPLFFQSPADRIPIRTSGSEITLDPPFAGDEASLKTEYVQWVTDHLTSGGAAEAVVTFEQWKAVTGSLRQPPGQSMKPAERSARRIPPSKPEIDQVALGYFSWLKTHVQSCVDPTGEQDITNIPCRITLPSFGNQKAAQDRLLDILQRAGWKSDDCAVVHEPFANAIGLFTLGRNRVWKPAPVPQDPHPDEELAYPAMFGGTPIFRAMEANAAAHVGQRVEHPYWVLTVDIGGFTTDFSMVGLDLDDLGFLETTAAAPSRFAKRSVVAGVRHLDELVLDVLSERKRVRLLSMMNSVDQAMLEAFHQSVYKNLEQFTSVTTGVSIMDDVTEREAIVGVLDSFSSHVCTALDDFMESHQYRTANELVLTGGGFNCPVVRDAVMRRARENFATRLFTVPMDEGEQIQGNSSAECRRVEPMSLRASTAIGGASVLFDFRTSD